MGSFSKHMYFSIYMLNLDTTLMFPSMIKKESKIICCKSGLPPALMIVPPLALITDLAMNAEVFHFDSMGKTFASYLMVGLTLETW